MRKYWQAEKADDLVAGSYVVPPRDSRWHLVTAGPDRDGRIVLIDPTEADPAERVAAGWCFPLRWRPADAPPPAFAENALRRRAVLAGTRGRHLVNRETRLIALADRIGRGTAAIGDDRTISRELVLAALDGAVLGGVKNLRESHQPSACSPRVGIGAEMRTREIGQFATRLMRLAADRPNGTLATRKVTLMMHRVEVDPVDEQRVVLFFPGWELTDDADAIVDRAR